MDTFTALVIVLIACAIGQAILTAILAVLDLERRCAEESAREDDRTARARDRAEQRAERAERAMRRAGQPERLQPS